MRYPWLDWVFMGAMVVAIIIFFSFASQRAANANVVGGNIVAPPQDCVAKTGFETIPLSYSILFCPNTVNDIDHFELADSGLVINCQGSTLHGRGGALFVAQTVQPTITLRNCVVEGFDGLFTATNPVNVVVENDS